MQKVLCVQRTQDESEPIGLSVSMLLDFFSVLYGQTLNVGRVMTPTLGMAVMREAAISAFKSESFYTVQLGFHEFTATGERLKEKVSC